MIYLNQYKAITLKRAMELKFCSTFMAYLETRDFFFLGSNITGQKFLILVKLLVIFFNQIGLKVEINLLFLLVELPGSVKCVVLKFSFWGTSVVVTRTNKSVVPECLRNAITVTHSSVQTNTESDISIYNVPEHGLLTSSNINDLNSHLTSRIQI